ncbi:MAG: DCC1-like thiol-disulfide oxidoreductase family protein [Hyphomicrobium sp.]
MASTATFIFDGACGICGTWVGYWRELTGEKVVYRQWQEAAADFPAIGPEEFKRASQLVTADGEVLSGAAATFKLLSLAEGRGGWWWLYRHVPGFGALSEAAYRFLSTRRGLLATLTYTLWGRRLEPERYALVSWLFLRGARRRLSRRVPVAGGPDPRARRRERHTTPWRIPRGGTRRMGTHRLLAAADAVLARSER